MSFPLFSTFLLKKPKIYVWCQFFYPELVSTGQVVTELFVRLSSTLEVEVHCAQPTIKKSRKVPKVLHYEGVRVVRLCSTTFPKISIFGKMMNQITYSTSLLLKALFLPRESRINVFTDPFFLPLLLYILYPIKKFKYTITLFDLYPETLAKNRVLSPRGMLYRLLDTMTNNVYANASNVITIGRCMQKIVKNRPINWKCKPEFVPIWCDTENIRRKALPPNYYRELWNIKESCFVVGYSGNLARFHPIETFLQSAAILRNHNDIKFVFVGEGAKKDSAQQFCIDNKLLNCHFQSYVEREELGSLLSSFDCGLVGLNREQTGLSVPSKTVGLITAGVPVIACVDESSETALMILEGKCGYVCNPSDSEKLVECILNLKEDPNQCISFGENATLAANKSFQITDITNLYATFLKS